MNKQQIHNILSSSQMFARDKKDLVNLLSKVNGGISPETPIKETLEGNELVPVYDGENKAVNVNTLLNRVPKPDDEIKVLTSLANYQEVNSITNPFTGVLNKPTLLFYDGNFEFIYSIKIENIANKIIKTYYVDNSNTIKYKIYTLIPVSGGASYIYTYTFKEYSFFIELFLTQNSSTNKTAISGLSLIKDYTCQLTLTNKTLLGNYYNGTFTAFSEGKIVRYDIDSEGNVTQDLSINPELIGTVAKLEVGDADDICQRNLEIINMAITQANANHFDVDIDYGVGSATFTQGLADDEIAGTATIVVATGYITKYNLYGNGRVEKSSDDVNIFELDARLKALEGA